MSYGISTSSFFVELVRLCSVTYVLTADILRNTVSSLRLRSGHIRYSMLPYAILILLVLLVSTHPKSVMSLRCVHFAKAKESRLADRGNLNRFLDSFVQREVAQQCRDGGIANSILSYESTTKSTN